VCRLEFDLTHEQLEFLDNYLEENLTGVPVDEITEDTFERIRTAMGTYMMSLTPLMSELVTLAKEMTAQDITLKGEKNLLTCKDFNQNEIIDFLDNKKKITKFFEESFSELQVSFSPENDGFVIHNSSIITAPFKKGKRTAGTLGLIGPMRIDYAKFIPYLEYFSQRITDLLTQQDDETEEDDNV
jgi:heat-inducible transcriptional repressor